MASFAKLGLNGEVLQVVSVNNDTIKDLNNIEQEKLGIDFLTELYNWPVWKQTSYNTRNNKHSSGDDSKALRGNYAGIGYTYDEDNDIFWPPKPYASWVKNTTTAVWQSPIGDAPELTEEQINTHYYMWNESGQSWDLTEITPAE